MNHLETIAQNVQLSRRSLLGYALAAPLVAAATKFTSASAMPTEAAMSGPFDLPPLPYNYSALNPYIDTTTMRLHHDKHHAGYVKKLNEVVYAYPQYRNVTPQAMLMMLPKLPAAIREKVRNNAGGHVNHSMFWPLMSPNGGGAPKGEIARIIASNFGSFHAFKAAFNDAGEKRFGSGWVWLVNDGGRMKIISTPNQDNPISMGMFPVMGNDVWEHAYYLKYKNKRADYLNAWWNVVNWDTVNSRLRWMQSNWKA